jgi:radical SAM superfamily enzyme YgiQ (UPF0313 family)
VAEFKPQIVGFTAVSTQYPFVRSAACRLKRLWPDIYLILGGVHASLRPEEAIQSDFDAVCVGEGELPMAELVERMDSKAPVRGIRNLWIRQPAGAIEKNPTRDFLADLDSLPAPDREMWRSWVLARKLSQQVVLPSRGCPYSCSYCSNHALRKLAGGKYVRLRSPDKIVEEIRALKCLYPETTNIYLQSETIAIKVEWLDELANQINAFNEELEAKISFACNFRVARQFLNDRVFGALARANVRTVEIGLESGSERLRREVLRRDYSNEEFFEAVALARRHGMAVNTYNMIGLPGETPADHQETIEVNRRICPGLAYGTIFFPYPGTDLFETCKAQNLLPEGGDITAERAQAMLDLPTFPKAEVQRAREWFDYRVYRGHRPWHYRLRRVLGKKAGAHAWSHLLIMRLLLVRRMWRR